jgi:hypothetical protein
MFGGFLTTGCDWCVSPAPELRGRTPAASQGVVDAAAPSRQVDLADRAPVLLLRLRLGGAVLVNGVPGIAPSGRPRHRPGRKRLTRSPGRGPRRPSDARLQGGALIDRVDKSDQAVDVPAGLGDTGLTLDDWTNDRVHPESVLA